MKKIFFKNVIPCWVLMVIATTAHSQVLTISTFAGNLAPGSADGVSNNAQFYYPNGVAADSAGNVYVADTVNSTIRKISTNGVVTTFAGLAGNSGSADGTGTSARFNRPQGIAVDASTNIFVADTANATIRKVTAAGVVTTFAGFAGNFNSFDGAGSIARFYQPQALAVDGAGSVYVADTWNHTIRKITPAGVVSTLAGLAGNFGAADGTNSKARFNSPAGIALDAATNLFVADFQNHTVRKITPTGTVSTIAGSAGVWGNADGTNSAARFFQPQGISADSAGNLFVADSGNQTIRKISPAGTNWIVSTVAGLPGSAGSLNGTGSGAEFYFPAGLALDGSGNLYVADFGNNTIRTDHITPPSIRFYPSANHIVLSWPLSPGGFGLETSTTLDAGAVWVSLTNATVSGDSFFSTNYPVGAAYYRLHKQ